MADERSRLKKPPRGPILGWPHPAAASPCSSSSASSSSPWAW